MKFLPLVLAALCLAPCALSAQSPASPKYEMRGVWVATVVNLDWPVRGASPSSQQQALRTMFDKLQQTGINTIFFQIRSESDAMYASTLEPWSYYLTGQQGLPPSPSWDPLAFAIEEAHKRGMELHAWINPFRVIRSVTSTYPKAQNHLSVQHPDWMLTVKTVMLLNPGIPEARQYLVNLLTDVVKRYDIDGLHYDDYFYPYEGVTTEDQATYAVYGTGMTLNAWREDNINRFVKELSEAALGIKPWLKYGISPFGIWRSGNPPGITGLSGADVTYGNAVKWLQEKWIDYLSPQLYWPFGGNQDFAKLSLWWKTQMNGRHLYPGLALYRADPSMTSAASLFTPSEIPKQIRFLRENGIPGALHFRAANISVSTTQGVPDSLRTDLYRHRAFTPVMEWKDIHAPAPPQQVELLTESGNRRLRWSQPAPQGQQASPRFFCVYRLQASAPPDWSEAVNNPQNLLTLTDKFEYVDQTPSSSTPYWYAVSTLSRNSVESAPVAPDAVTSVKDIARTRFHITQIYPNPFESEVRIRFSLDESSHLTLRIVNLQGQEVARLANSAPFSPGEHEVVWNAPTGNKRQVYVCVLEGGGKTAAKKMIRL
ncbi:MAG: hypothetical protein KIPDCIKN_02168 [Haliscomenobacter sp.]|nr:hypothetical protein [Haliscomenobacter sp.]